MDNVQENRCISVVIPTYNRLWALKRAVRFFLEQPEVAEVVVVVDGCVDGTAEWVFGLSNSEARVRGHVSVVNGGASKARNLGARMAKSPYVFFADDDMVLAPSNGLALLVRELMTNKADIVTSPFICLENGPPLKAPRGTPPGGDLVVCHRKLTLELIASPQLALRLPATSFASALGTGIMLMKRSVLDTVRYDEGLGVTSYRDETDFQLKAYAAGYRLYVCPMVQLVDMVRQGDSGGCHRLSRFRYTFDACRNNWRILKRHAQTLRAIGVACPIWWMQAVFFIEHFLCRFPRQTAGGWIRRLGLGGVLNHLRGRAHGQR